MNSAALAQAIYDRLTGYAPVNDAVQGVYTKTPQAAESEDSAAFPYITIGPFVASPWDTKTDNGTETVAQIHLWSRSGSALTWRGICDDIHAALHNYALSVSGANVVNCLFDGSTDDIGDPDGVTNHVVSSFRVTMEQS